MSRYFRLVDFIDTPQKLTLAETVQGRNGSYVKYGHCTVVPGKKYELKDDPAFVNSLKAATVEVRYSDQKKAVLDMHNVAYTERRCRSCGGRNRWLKYNIIEIVEE